MENIIIGVNNNDKIQYNIGENKSSMNIEMMENANDRINKKDSGIISNAIKVHEFNSNIDNNVHDEMVSVEHYKKKDKYTSRDISWMEFNERVLNLCKDDSIPLLEQLKFIGISSNNLDEFIMVRIGGLLKSINNNPMLSNINGMLPKEEYTILDKSIKKFINLQIEYLKLFSNKCGEYGIKLIRKKSELTSKSRKYIQRYFDEKLYGMITPIVFDNSRPFPLINNKSINIGALLEDTRFNYNMFGTIQVPTNAERVIEIKSKDIPDGERHFILLEDIIKFNLNKIFVDKKIIDTCYYRVLRNFDDDVDNKPNVFLADKMKESLKRRETGEIVYLQITKSKKEMLKIIQRALNVAKERVIKLGNNPIDFTFTTSSIELTPAEEKKFKFKEFNPQLGADLIGETDIFDAIDRGDILLHHPYESYDSVVNFIKRASIDKDVVSIKQTLYRLSSNSPIMESLIKAAENGKHVTVLLEIKARFNEKDNLFWASKLENAGGHVIYGVNNLKTHCKLTIVTKKSKKNNLKQYAHVGTGNYNDVTAKIYTDLSLFTSDKNICSDISNLFNMLTGFSEPKLNKIYYAPNNLRDSIISYIDNEIQTNGEVTIKVNSLSDKVVIDKLYEASKSGIKINLIVRGSCSLVTELKGLSDNIRVISNVGRFLEHSRIFYFKNANKIFIGSSDLMERNLDKRFEIICPVDADEAKTRIKNMLNVLLDDCSGYELHGSKYIKRENIENKPSAQTIFCNLAENYNKIKNVNKLFMVKK